jgi:hypothetical protein
MAVIGQQGLLQIMFWKRFPRSISIVMEKSSTETIVVAAVVLPTRQVLGDQYYYSLLQISV